MKILINNEKIKIILLNLLSNIEQKISKIIQGHVIIDSSNNKLTKEEYLKIGNGLIVNNNINDNQTILQIDDNYIINKLSGDYALNREW